jgi:putative membrane protein insertion efficiency factor
MSRLILFFIKFYQLVVSPWLGPNCRFTPTCSQYAVEAVDRYGAW